MAGGRKRLVEGKLIEYNTEGYIKSGLRFLQQAYSFRAILISVLALSARDSDI